MKKLKSTAELLAEVGYLPAMSYQAPILGERARVRRNGGNNIESATPAARIKYPGIFGSSRFRPK